MSYTDLILEDSPVSVWSLNETSGTSVQNDKFLLGNSYNGTYLGASGANVKRIKVPLVYGGGQCIKLIENNVACLRIPSLDKMSSANRQYTSTLEFWLKITNSTTSEITIVKKPNSSTGLYVKDNYLIFKLGDQNTVSTSLPIDNFNKPLHVAISYNPKGISLFVNGVESSAPIVDLEYFTKVYNSSDEYFDFFGSSSIGIYVDSVAIYNYEFTPTISKRHFIYGVGYDISKFSISSKAGTMYSMHMENTSKLYSLSYNTESSWLNNLLIEDGSLEVQRDGYLTTNNYSTIEHVTFSDVSYETMYGANNGEISFPHGTSLYVSDKVSSFPNGMISKFDFTGVTWTTKQLLFKIDSSTDAGLSVYAEKVGSEYKIYYSTDYIDGTTKPDTTILSSNTQITGNLYLGFYELDNVLGLFLQTSSNQYISTNTELELPLISSSISFGAETISPFANTEIIPSNEIVTNRFTGKLNLIGALKDSSSIPANFSAFENYDYNYKITPSNEKRLIRYTKGKAKFYLGTNFFGTTNVLPHRIDLGYGEVTGDSFVTLEATVYNQTSELIATQEILSGDPIKGLLGQAITDHVIRFDITLKSDDYEVSPPVLQYLNLNVFNSINSSVEMRSDIGDQNITITAKSGQDLYLPEVNKTPSMYYGNATGLKIGDQYGTINYLSKGIGTETSDGISTIMFTAKPTTSSQCRFIYSDPVIIRQTSGTVAIAGTAVTGNIYVNGTATTSAETNEWNHYIIALDNPITIDTVNGTAIEIGNSSSTTGTFYIDNLCFLGPKLTATEALKYYNLFYSSYSEPVKDSIFTTGTFTTGSPTTITVASSTGIALGMRVLGTGIETGTNVTNIVGNTITINKNVLSNQTGINLSFIFLNVNFYDKEVRNDNLEYELIPGQNSIKSTVSLAATENYTLSSNQINYSNDIDLIEIDSISAPTLASPVTVLLANQTSSANRGVYSVGFSNGVATFTPDTSLEAADILTGDLIYVQNGDQNEKEFLQKQSDGTYSQVSVLSKIVSYKESDLTDSE